MRVSSLFKKNLFIILALLALTTAVNFFYATWNLDRNLSECYRNNGIAIGSSVANSSAEFIKKGNAASLQALVDGFKKIEGVVYVFIINERNEVVAHTSLLGVPPAAYNFMRTNGSLAITEKKFDTVGQVIDVSLPISAGNLGHVHVGMGKMHIRRQIFNAAIAQILISLGVFAIVSIFVYLLFKKTIDEPLNAVIVYAKKLVAHEFDVEIDLHTNDEFDALSSALNFLAIDITEIFAGIEQAIVEIAEKDKILTDTLEYLNAVIDNMADGLLVANTAGEIVRINDPLARIFDIAVADVSNNEKSVKEVFGQEMARLIKQCTQKGAAAVDLELSSGKVLKASATVIHMQEQSHGQNKDSNHDKNSIVVIVRDVTKEREVDRMKTDFISTVSHELRTPLTSILGFAEIIKDRLETQIFPNLNNGSPKVPRSVKLVKDNMNIILQEGTRLTSLINDVLDIAKMEAGKVEWKTEQVSVAELIDRALQSTWSLFTAKGLGVVKEVEEDLPLIWGDRDRLLQVMINLISNAVKFTDSGSIICQAKKCTQGLMVSVIDTGKGIDAHDHDKVFEKFRQIGDTLIDKPMGTGLGLPISKQIIQHHGGHIWVESSPGRGSKFSFNIPVSTPEEALAVYNLPKISSSASPISASSISSFDVETLISRIEEHVLDVEYSGEGKVKTILAVDDDESIRELLRQELEGHGYYVKTAKDGLEALDSIRKQKP
ncbi:MAG: hypothetical protein HQK89_17745, partial [Nitrospirae bacterium]|nr:hypothetical protein [Nitrospirota bacterium]